MLRHKNSTQPTGSDITTNNETHTGSPEEPHSDLYLWAAAEDHTRRHEEKGNGAADAETASAPEEPHSNLYIWPAAEDHPRRREDHEGRVRNPLQSGKPVFAK